MLKSKVKKILASKKKTKGLAKHKSRTKLKKSLNIIKKNTYKTRKIIKKPITKISKKDMKLINKKKKSAKSMKTIKKTKVVIIQTHIPQKKKMISSDLKLTLIKPEARHWLIELGGENTLDVIMNLPTIPNDEELAKKLKIKVSEVRTALNKLHNSGLVTYIRNKNNETGWYSYTWTLNEEKITKQIKEHEMHNELYAPQEGVVFYFCKDCGLKSAVKFEIAAECLFKCQICNSSLDFLDREKIEHFKKLKNPER